MDCRKLDLLTDAKLDISGAFAIHSNSTDNKTIKLKTTTVWCWQSNTAWLHDVYVLQLEYIALCGSSFASLSFAWGLMWSGGTKERRTEELTTMLGSLLAAHSHAFPFPCPCALFTLLPERLCSLSQTYLLVHSEGKRFCQRHLY